MADSKQADVDDASFSFAECDCVAFDLDHTAVRYHVPALEDLVFRAVIRYLVEVKSYPQATRDLVYPSDFALKGLVLDRWHGNLLKVSADLRVLVAYHGTKRRLSDEEILDIYPDRKLPYPFAGVSTDQYIPCTSYFDRPLGPLFGLLVDQIDATKDEDEGTDPKEYATLTNDLLGSLYHNFATYESGFFFPEIREQPEKFLFKRPQVAKWFTALRDAGVRVILLTNSLPPFTRLLAEYAFGSGWRDLFDMVIFQARKPAFWLTDKEKGIPPFNQIRFDDDGKVGGAEQAGAEARNWRSSPAMQRTEFPFARPEMDVYRLESGKMYENGHVDKLTEFIGRLCQKEINDLTLCYVGDHLLSDVAICKQAVRWRTIAVVEELEHPDPKEHSPSDDGGDLHDDRNPYWGSFFTGKLDGKLVDTTSMKLIRDHADLSCACLSSFTTMPVKEVYDSPNGHVLEPCALLLQKIPSYGLYYYADVEEVPAQ